MAHKKVSKKSTRPYVQPIPQMAQLGTPEQRWIQASSDRLLGRYTNVALVKHTPREFVLDFLLSLGGDTFLTSRIITSPQHAKELYHVLGDNIKKYESKNGEIKLEPK